MRNITSIIKALADENRLRAVAALEKRELCACQLNALLELAPSTVSKHMSILHQASLVKSRKSGRWVHYRLPGKNASPEIRKILHWILTSLAEKPETLRDRERLDEILYKMPESFCQPRRKRTGTCPPIPE